MNEQSVALIIECKKQEESCLYHSTTLYEWIKFLYFWQTVFIIFSVVLGGIAGLSPLLDWYPCIGSICGCIAGILPAVYKALELDYDKKSINKCANEFKILQNRFRQLSSITALDEFDRFHSEFIKLREKLEDVLLSSLPAPERFFKKAQKKINAGHYQFSIDNQKLK